MTDKLMMYALGGARITYDGPAIRTSCATPPAATTSFSSLVLGIVNSVPFQMRGERGASGAAARGRC